MKAKSAGRSARLAAALKENLKRRKVQPPVDRKPPINKEADATALPQAGPKAAAKQA
jgi:hypothetical protein